MSTGSGQAEQAMILSACRTAIGTFLGGLSSVTAPQLGAVVIKEAVKRAGIDVSKIDEVIMGQVVQGGSGQGPARIAAIQSGIPSSIPSMTINKVCGSGLKSVMLAAQAIKAGDAECFVAGGMESMSCCPYYIYGARTGLKFGEKKLVDAMIYDGLWDSFNDYHMGNAAEFTAKKSNISREEQDELAVLSHERALKAQYEGYFENEIVPTEVRERKKANLVVQDEHPREDATLENLAKLPAVFSEEGTVTAGNASAINDGAAAIVLATKEACKEYGMKPLVKTGAWSIKAADPKLTGVAPVPAIRDVLASSGLSVSDLNLIEINEAFAAYYLACEKELGLKRDRVNVKGSGISLGHPVGATGCRIVVTLIHEMMRQDVGLGLASLCAGGGMGYAILIGRDSL